MLLKAVTSKCHIYLIDNLELIKQNVFSYAIANNRKYKAKCKNIKINYINI